MSVLRTAAATIAVLALAGCASFIAPRVSAEPEALREGAYRLDPEHAALLFKIDHMGFSSFVGRFEKFDATLDFDPDNPEAARVEAIVDMTSLDIANDAFAATLLGPDWFDAGAFPQAVFRSTLVEATGSNTGRMTADLTLHGVTRPVTLDVVFNGGGQDLIRGAYVVGFSASGRISRKAFGVENLEAIVGDDVRIEIEAEFLRR